MKETEDVARVKTKMQSAERGRLERDEVKRQ